MQLSVILCTHNPRRDYLECTLTALREQTLAPESWELILIDNGSTTPLISHWDLSWHPRSFIIREEKLGLTPARLRGIETATSPFFIFVDDDNVLAPNYLEQALAIFTSRPDLGAFGGKATPLYETACSPEVQSLADAVALVRPVERPTWSNLYISETTPFGAGLCVRRGVALAYSQAIEHDPTRRSLDKTGQVLTLCGDTDLAWTSIDLGLACGAFPELHFTHLVPSQRVTCDYLLRVVEGFWFSWVVLHRVRKLPLERFLPYQARSTRALWWWLYWRKSAFARLVSRAEWNGQWRGARLPL